MFRKRQISQITQELQLFSKSSTHQHPNHREPMTIQNIPDGCRERVFSVLQQNFNAVKLSDKFLRDSQSIFYIDPMSHLTGFWSFAIIMDAYFLMFQISLTLGFGPKFWTEEIAETQFFTAYICLLVLLFLDMLVNFNKGYYGFGSGKIISDPAMIRKKYFRYHFWIDLTTLLLLLIPIFVSQFYVNFIQLIPLVFLYIKKFKCQDQITNSLKYNRTLRNVFILTMLGCDIMLIGNFGACIFMGMDLLLWDIQYYGDNGQYYWLINDSSYSVDLMNGPRGQQYVFAQSFSTGTLSTLAPGPFGKNPIQIFYAIVLMTYFMLLASYAGQVLVQVLYSYEEIRIFHEKNIQKFDQFMTLKGVSQEIRQKVHNFFELIWEVEVKMNADLQKETINKFPLSIQEELYLEMGFCRYSRMFSNFSKRALLEKQISLKINSQVIDEGTLIFNPSTPIAPEQSGLCKFYFTQSDNQSILSLSNIEKTIGQYQFITGTSYCYGCKAIDLCIIEKIKYSDFIALLQSYEIMEQLHILKYKMLIERKLNLVCKICLICEEEHLESQCSSIDMANQVRDELKDTGGVFKARRKKIERRQMKNKKIRGRDIKMSMIKENPASVFKKFKILGEIILGISKTQREVETLHRFTNYYPEFNL